MDGFFLLFKCTSHNFVDNCWKNWRNCKDNVVPNVGDFFQLNKVYIIQSMVYHAFIHLQNAVYTELH